MMKPQFKFIKAALSGAGIAFLAISFFVFSINQPKPEWGEFWMVKPLILTPLIGSVSGSFSYFIYDQISRLLNTKAAIFYELGHICHRTLARSSGIEWNDVGLKFKIRFKDLRCEACNSSASC